ncbi:hypothetical protein [Xanthomonas translucens]|uniref:hypothetical protein n=1 Tax=Xanthomonas campestris pv. translucens TaxID=343 RepID=UPI0012D914E6|nr:hypothetical protein [Xanthomonas translucens]
MAAVLAAIKSRWLYVIAPKLYLHTPISDGQIISLSIHNAGLLAEEDVAVTFRSACKFELIATSKSTLVNNGNTISLPKLSRLESVTVIILVEGKAFESVDIESVESKSTNGKVVESKEAATALWQHFILVPFLILVLAVPFFIGNFIGADMKTSIFEYLKEHSGYVGSSKQLAGYKSSIRESYASESLKGSLSDSRLVIRTVEVLRRGDILEVTTSVKNNLKEPLTVSGSIKSSSEEGSPLSYGDSQIGGTSIGVGEVKVVRQKAFLPESASTKFLSNRIQVETISGDSINVSQVMEFD